MKVLLVSDLHFGVQLPHAKLSVDRRTSDRLKDVAAVGASILELAESEGASAIFVLGDLFDKAAPAMETIRVVAETLKSWASESRPVFVMPGNHDAYDKAGAKTTLELFRTLDLPNIHIMDGGKVATFDEVVFWALPWVPDVCVSQIVAGFPVEEDTVDVCLIHQTVDGCVDGKRSLSSPLKESALDAFDVVFSGHIHQPQRIGRVQYLGSPLQLRFGDDGKRGVYTFDLDELAVEFHPLTSPVFFARDITAGQDLDEIEDALLEFLPPEGSQDAPCEVYVRLRVKGEREDVDAEMKTLAELKQWFASEGGIARKWLTTRVYTDDGVSERIRELVSKKKVADTETLVSAYTAACKPPSDLAGGTIAPDVLAKAGMEFLSLGAK